MNSFLHKTLVNGVSSRQLTVVVHLAYIVLLTMMFNQSVAAQANSVATIARITNTSTITSTDGELRDAVVREQVYAGESLETGEDAWLTVNFFDLTRLVLRPNSKLIVHKFPETMSSDKIEFEILSGGVRLTTGTMAAQHPERFSVITPNGELSGGRTEWVIRICNGDECDLVEQTFNQCSDYKTIDKIDKQFVAAYKGEVNYQQCPTKQKLKPGQTSVFDYATQRCNVIDQVPCFILFDQKLGRDKVRTFLTKLTPTAEALKARPSKRPSIQPRPRIKRPRRPARGR